MDTSQPVNEIALDRLSPADRLLIETANSVYMFVVRDPTTLQGSVIRGAIEETDAVVLGTQTRGGDSKNNTLKLEIGSRAIFFISSGGRLKSVITSVITRLIHMKSHQR